MIEFRDNDEYCRWNNILMSPEKCKELFGIYGELEKMADDVWYYEGWIYSGKSFGETLKLFGTVLGDEEIAYFSLKPDTLLLYTEAFFDDIEGIKPVESFFIDYPDFDIFKYNEFYNELDEYYKTGFNYSLR